MGQCSVYFINLAFAFMIFTICQCPLQLAHAQKTSLASSSLPPALRDQLSPLTREQELYYGNLMKKGGGAHAMSENDLNEFCKSARLLCGAAMRESAWGSAKKAEMASMKGAESSLIDRSASTQTQMEGEPESSMTVILLTKWLPRKASLPSTSTP